ncbi:DUF3306 domain-containing protein [Belnapia sp. T6]|uniref:DUF3306 domain-containing protein n=1 Tax=Belnapia mucosa TaxID=2804532 RepID=A0ABS1V4V0_9PROT|nr:DUF3306 domain-containing protein [Belnapia mucosa]MBL6456722.1 DUF3306 domain-containing protein [Belnapia mucosa]
MSGEGFLSRWSRRKREAVQQAEPELPAPVEQAASPEPFDPASLPPVESLTEASDFTAFLRAEVPAALRQAALRRAWTLDPAIRDFIGPADYAWDYNAPDGVPGFAASLAGDVTKLIEQAVGAVERIVAEPEAPEAVPAAEELVVAALPQPMPDPRPEPAAEPAPDLAPEPPPPRRRHGGAIPV